MEDTLYNYLHLYNKSPKQIKSLLGKIYSKVPLKFRYGEAFGFFDKLLKNSEFWTRSQIEEFQWKKISGILNYAYNNVPYYKELFDIYGVKIRNIQNFNDFKIIPMLNKRNIRENLEKLKSKALPKNKFLYVTTGGSSGTPIGLYYQKNLSRAKELAFTLKLWSKIGYKYGDKIALLRGNIVKDYNKGNFCDYDPIKNRLILSSYHMTDENLPRYIEKIVKFKPLYLHVYPSSLYILAEFMKKNNIKLSPKLNGIFTSSENLYDWQRKIFEDIFNCKIIDLYGLREAVAFAGNCEHKAKYHIFPEYSYTELINGNKEQITAKNKIGEIVGTSFDNYAMPLIRYRTMDYAILEEDSCECGKNGLLLKKILGRIQEFFVDKDGCLTTFTGSDDALWGIKDKIYAYQYLQIEPGVVFLNIDEKTNLSKDDLLKVRNEFLRHYAGFELNINIVKNIPRTPSGKFRYLDQKLPMESHSFKNFTFNI